MKRYHAHIYFRTRDLELARILKEHARLMGLFEFVKLHEQPVGPHPTGMIELHFADPIHASAVQWVKVNRGVFSALIHQDTGDDLRDHTEGIQWLGKKLPLDFTFFELIKVRADLRIHQENKTT